MDVKKKQMKRNRLTFNKALMVLTLLFLNGCLSPLLSTAQLAYDRHELHKSMSDHQLAIKANHRLFGLYPHLKRQHVAITVYNHDLVVTGQVRTNADKLKVNQALGSLAGVRRFFNQVTVGKSASFSQSIKDSWLTGKIRAKMAAANEIDPSAFKIITEKNVVYILGDVKERQAQIVVNLAQSTSGVKQVIKILRYYHYKG